VKVVLQLFDILYINGKSLLQQSLRQRRDILKASFVEEEGFLYFASGADHVEDGDTAPIEALMGEACAAMCEGLMVKTLDQNASYEPSRRSLNWLKLKKDYIDGMGVCDSVDLVVIGAYQGRGKRANCYGAYLMACYDADRDEFQSVCKVGTGFKDEELTRLTEMLRPTILGSNKRPINYNVGDLLTPDVWFEASVVWELQAADLSKSNAHKGGIGRLDDKQRGIGLRFPRFIRERADKNPEGATTAEQIVDMYISQGNDNENKGTSRDDGADDDDDDLGI
jgi:DNA ligase 1